MRSTVLLAAAVAMMGMDASQSERDNSVWKRMASGYSTTPRSNGPKGGKTARRAKQKVSKKVKQKNRSRK